MKNIGKRGEPRMRLESRIPLIPPLRLSTQHLLVNYQRQKSRRCRKKVGTPRRHVLVRTRYDHVQPRSPVVPSSGDEQLLISPDLDARRPGVLQGKLFDHLTRCLPWEVNESRHETYTSVFTHHGIRLGHDGGRQFAWSTRASAKLVMKTAV